MYDRTNKLNLNGIYNFRSDKIVLPRNININYLDKEIFLKKIEEELNSFTNSYHSLFVRMLPILIDDYCVSMYNLKNIDTSLSLLGCIASIAAADRGFHMVKSPDDQLNNLSVIISAGIHSGGGKSTSLEPFINIFKKREELEGKRVEEKNYCIQADLDEIKNKLRRAQKSSNREINIQCRKKINELTLKQRSSPCLLMTDITPEGYNSYMEKQGYVIRLEPDGGTLKNKIQKLQKNFWQNEPVTDVRVSQASRRIRDPFFVDLCFIQPKYYNELVSDNDNIESGYTSRMIMYSPSSLRLSEQYSRYHNSDAYNLFERALNTIFDNSETYLESVEREHIIYTLSDTASEYYKNFKADMAQEAEVSRVPEWCRRAAQQSLKLAAIFRLAEYPDNDPNNIISNTEMDSAIAVILQVYEHVKRSVISFNDEKTHQCILRIAKMCCEDLGSEFTAKDVAQSLKTSYSSSIVHDALNYLEYKNFIYEKRTNRVPRRGRPQSKIYVNNIY